MSSKQSAIDMIRQLNEDASMAEIVETLKEALAIEEALRRHDERGGFPDDDVTDEEWALFVAQGLRDELADPREDIYTLEDETPYKGPK